MSNCRYGAPPDSENWISLGNGLHDAYLVSLVDHGCEGSVELEVKPGFPVPQGEFLQPVKLVFEGVTHALAFVQRNAPNGPRAAPGMSKVEWRAALDEYLQNSRIESISLGELGEKIQPRDLDAMDANYGLRGDQLILRVSGNGQKGVYVGWEIQIVALNAFVRTSAGNILSLDDLEAAGAAAWDQWQRREPTGPSPN